MGIESKTQGQGYLTPCAIGTEQSLSDRAPAQVCASGGVGLENFRPAFPDSVDGDLWKSGRPWWFGDIYSVQLSVTPTVERTCVTDTTKRGALF